MSGGQRHWVSAQDMVAIGLTSAQIATIGADQFNAIPLGGEISWLRRRPRILRRTSRARPRADDSCRQSTAVEH